MAFRLTNDGTMDTLVRCDACGAVVQYTYDPAIWRELARRTEGNDEDVTADGYERGYYRFVEWCIADAESDHECSEDEGTRHDVR